MQKSPPRVTPALGVRAATWSTLAVLLGALHDFVLGQLGELPPVDAELFIAAGALTAERLTRERAAPAGVERILRRALDQAAAVSGGRMTQTSVWVSAAINSGGPARKIVDEAGAGAFRIVTSPYIQTRCSR